MSDCVKIKYLRKKDADFEIKKQIGKGNDVKLNSYYCTKCGSYHLTKQKDSDIRALNAKINEMKLLISDLNEQIKGYKAKIGNNLQIYDKEIRKEKLYREQSEQLLKKGKEVKDLRTTISTLISKMNGKA